MVRRDNVRAPARRDGEDDQREDGTEDEARVKTMFSFQEVGWLNVPPDRGEADMEEQRQTWALAALSRVSKETKLRLRVIFLDDSERSFEVEVSSRQRSQKVHLRLLKIIQLARFLHVDDGFSSRY